jgi:hypothetical protein
MLRILTKLPLASTSQDSSFERSLAFMLAQRDRRGEWLMLKRGAANDLTRNDLAWIPTNGGSSLPARVIATPLRHI